MLFEDEENELEEINRDIEKKITFEINIINNINNAEKNFKKEDFKVIADTTYYFKQNIERVWNIIKNFEMILVLNDSNHYPCIIKRGSNTFTKGNIFEGKLFGLFEFHAKVLKEKTFPERKKIERILFLENGEVLKLKIILYKVTKEDSCVLNWISKYAPKYGDKAIFKIKEKFNGKQLFKRIENILEKHPIDLYQYESGIIQGKMEEIWNILTDNKKLAAIVPNNKCFVPININNIKVGEIVNVCINMKGIDGSIKLKLDLKEQKKEWNKWLFGTSIIGGKPFKVVKQSAFVQLTKINKVETQLSVFTKIHDPISNEIFKKLSHNIKYVIYSLKNHFDNFYSSKCVKNKNL